MKEFNYLTLIFVAFLLFSCISKNDYEEILAENTKLTADISLLKQEIEELKYNAEKLLNDGEQFYKANEMSKAKNKFELILEKYADSPLSIKAKHYLTEIKEKEDWEKVLISENTSDVQEYIDNYPKGKYIKEAQEKLDKLTQLEMDKAYGNAKIRNSSNVWEEFLEKYPHYPKASAIKEKIIRLKVDEILNDEKTGQMPSFESNSYSHSSTSTVTIENNTGCSLTVRYSGAEAKEIIIYQGEAKTVRLKSGSYKIAASACGTSYAGHENLNGSYSSTFYITRY